MEYCFSISGYQPDRYFDSPSALTVDERCGLVYVADAKQGSVSAFTLQGLPRLRYDSAQGLKSPLGVAVNRAGDLYVSDAGGGPLKVIHPKGDTSDLAVPASLGEPDPMPGRMTFDQDGNLYVIDTASQCIRVIDGSGKLKLKIGRKGDKRGEFREVEDVAVDRLGRVYATDSLGAPVQVFDRKGKYLYKFGFRGDGAEDLAISCGISVDRNGQVWVVDKGQHALKVFDRSGTFLRKFGRYGQSNGMFVEPTDLATDGLGRSYVLEAGARRVQVLALNRPFEPLLPPSL